MWSLVRRCARHGIVILSIAGAAAVRGDLSSAGLGGPRQDSGAATARARPLAAGSSRARVLRGGETHRYPLALHAGQFLHVVVTPRDIDVTVTLTGPADRDPVRVDVSSDVMTTEAIVAIAGATGHHQVAVSASSPRALPGRYTVRVEAIRPSTERDRAWVRARQALDAGARLQATGESTSLSDAETRLLEALAGLRASGDGAGEAEALFLLARNALDRATPDTVERAHAALAACRARHDRVGMAKAAQLLGSAHERKGELPEALAAMSDALALSQTIGSRAAEARARLSLSVLYGRSGDAERGIGQSREALRLFRALRMPASEVAALNNMGIASRDLGEYRLSLQYYEEALRIARALGNRALEAGLLNNLGNLYRQVGEYQKALAAHRDALTLSREVKNEEHEARALNTLGMTYRRLGAYQTALDYHEQSLAIRRRRSDLAAQASTLDAMGQAWHALGNHDRAMAYLDEALAIRHRIADRYSETETLRHLAQVERDRGNLDAALAHVDASVALTDSLRRTMVSPDLRASFVAAQQEQYELHVDVLMQMHRRRPDEGFQARALEASERGRARVLLESLHGALDLDAPASLEVPRLALLTQPRTLTAAAIQQELLDRDTILLELTLGEQRSWLWAVGADTLASFELPPRREIEAAARRIYALLTARQPRAGESPAQRGTRLVEADAAWREESAALGRMLFGAAVAHLGEAWRGKRLLIVAAGVLEYLPFAALPDPALNPVPGVAPAAVAVTSLASAATGQPGQPGQPGPPGAPLAPLVPLVADHEIVNLPSASVLAVMRQESAGRRPPPKRLAVLADPVFDAADPRVTPSRSPARSPSTSTPAPPPTPTRRVAAATTGPSDLDARSDAGAMPTPGGGLQRPLGRLPFSRQEAQAIAAFVPVGERLEALGFQASRALATSAALGEYRIVHFATHGWLDSERPELSGLAFSLVGRDGAAQDGVLRLRDIYALRLPADVVVLSACQTALGQDIKGEGLIGLTRGFMHAGARRVVASLWQVDDLATAELMRLFYRGMLQEGLRPAAALRVAQRELSTQARWASPYYWSAFVLQGEWR